MVPTLRFVLLLLSCIYLTDGHARVIANSAENQSVQSKSPTELAAILENSCLHCHEGNSAEGGLDLQTLSGNLSDPNVAAKWVRIHDRVASGEMPPPADEELAPNDRQAFVELSSKWIGDYQRHQHRTNGRVKGRRLSNIQLERTLQDLLAIDTPLARLMPAEPRSDGFYGIADSQSMSHFQLESHLTVVDAALDTAFDRLMERDQTFQRDLSATALCKNRRSRSRCREPEMREGAAVVWACTLPFYGRITPTRVPMSGWYQVKVNASAVKSPEQHGVWCSVRSGQCVSNDPLLNYIGSFEAGDEAAERTFEAWIDKNDLLEIKPADSTLKKARFRGGQVGAGEGEPQNVPGVAMHNISLSRIYPNGDRDDVYQSLFGDLRVKIDRKANQLTLVSEDPAKDTANQLRKFIQKAFRRPTAEPDMKPYLRMLRQAIGSGEDPITALRSTYRAILCSPRFVYFVEPFENEPQHNIDVDSKDNSDGRIDQFAIANRLSYLLTGTMPDVRLMQLAKAGKLNDEKVIHMQVDRLLKGQRGKSFSNDFASQWLDLIDIDFTEPDPRMFSDFDIVVQNAMVAETQAFLHSLLENNAPIERLIKSNFTFVNSRLARFYELDSDIGEQVKRVKLPADSVRGGLLSQGAILKVTANGTNTSPVLRGVWVSERILGTEIPPPPESVPAVEPDIRGAITIREQLQKHVAHEACATCHKNIDPPGYALENFDPAGKWREKYYYRNAKPGKKRPLIDASFTMPSGKEFDDFNEFRTLVCSNPDSLAHNFAAKVLVYGTGGKITFADRESLDTIVRQTKSHNHGLRSIVKAVVTSPTFQSK